jgi:hypothetical protein
MRDDEAASSDPLPRSRTTLPTSARILDLATLGFVIVAAIVALTGGVRAEIFGLPISVRSVDRLILLVTTLVAFRHWKIRHPSLWERLYRDQAHFVVPARRTASRRLGELVGLFVFYGLVVVAVTYPQVARLDSVPDHGDPLLSIWRLAWVAHQLPRDPFHLFDANIFYPERLTFTYSDAAVVPALMAAPLLWLGAHQLHVYNLLLLTAFTLSGVAMFVLVRSLTGRMEAALVAATIFALYPYRFEHYPHLELQMTFWMPLLLLAIHRMFDQGRLRDGIGVGVLFSLQTLSSLYYGVFLTVYLVPIAMALSMRSTVLKQATRSLAAAMVVAGILIAPIAAPYIANRSFVGERDEGAVLHYSATLRDYLQAHSRSPYDGRWDVGPHNPERDLFPTISPVALAVVGMWPPFSAARIGYTIALVLSVDASRGARSGVYRTLRSYVPPFRALRVPARFSMLVGLTLAILAGYGVARLAPHLRAPVRWAVTAATIAVVLAEVWPRLDLVRAWLAPPAIYTSLDGRNDVVLAEFPMPDISQVDDGRTTYFSTFHWHKIVSGISGHYPISYLELLAMMRDFPSDAALDYLRARGVTHLAVHGSFYGLDDYRAVIGSLDKRTDLTLIAAANFEQSESRLYELRR